jgi:lambda family phage tail tape measure protein
MNMDALLRIKADVQGENNIKRLGNSLQGLQGQAKNAALGFNSLKGAVGGFAAAIAGSAIVGGLGAIVKRSIDAGDELFNLQAKTGIAANALIGIGNAAKLADVDMATLGKGITKLNVNLVKAAEGNEDLARKFEALGVTLKDAEGKVVPADQALKQIADRFADMPDGAQKAAAAVALFGKAGADLIPLLNDGAAAMDKFTYKVSDDFAARSDLFNDTITTLEIKTQGFALELTNALLPSLQSILEVFSDLFNTEQDWSSLFTVITGGLRGVATFIYATIKLTDVLTKSWVAYFTVIGKGFKGDFAGAADVIKNTFGSLVQQATRDFAQIQKIWTAAPSPGPGLKQGGRNLNLDTSAADAKADADAKKRAADDKRRAAEAETLQGKKNALTKEGIDIATGLQRKAEDLNAAFKDVGATPVQQVLNETAKSLKEDERNIEDAIKRIDELRIAAEKIGGKLDKSYFEPFLTEYADAQKQLREQKELQGYKDLLPTLDSYKEKLKELTSNKKELTEVEQLNLQINSAQLDKLAETNPALATHLADLRERALLIDQTTQKQKDAAASFGVNFNESIKSYYDSINNLGADVGSAVVGTLQGLGDQLANFVTTGKLNFTDLANSIIKDMIRITTQQAIVKPLLGVLGSIFPGGGGGLSGGGYFDSITGLGKAGPNFGLAKGGVITQNGIQPFARGGIVDKPTLFPFAKGTGLMGEAGPEAIIPLRRGRDGNLGVAGGGGGGGATSVVVNVDAKGSNVEGDTPKGEQLGRALSQAVQQELLKQKRPGGLLS